MTTSEAVNEIAAALAKAQGKMKNAALNKVNPHFRSKYADLAGIRDAVVPGLTENGIAVVQTLGAADGMDVVFTRLIHTSGQWIESACGIPKAADMQKMGSALTYARRYSLSAICGIAADEDDDGNEAAGPAGGAPVHALTRGTESTGTFPPLLDQHWTDLTAAADEGKAKFDATWNDMPAAFKNYVMQHKKDERAALVARAKGKP